MSYLKIELLLDLASQTAGVGNKTRIREDAANSGNILLAVKLGNGAVQEVSLTAAEAQSMAYAFDSLVRAKGKFPANT